MIGRTIGPYRVLEEVGSGGMGVVYRAEDTRLGRQVALKFIAPGRIRDEDARQRFEREARAASALNHPNICTIHEIAHDGEQPFLVMELLKGESLAQRLARGALPLPELLDLAMPIADALDAAHRQGIIHRDLKPANIFITERGAPKLLDFGLAKLVATADDVLAADAATHTHSQRPEVTGRHTVLGTLPYMSPEQVRGQPLDARTDLFSFGAVLYEMATGCAPFAGETSGIVLDNVLARTPVNAGLLRADVPMALESIIAKALEKDRDLRYQSARDLLVDLKRLKGSASRSSATETAAPTPHNRRRAMTMAAVGVVAVIGIWYAGSGHLWPALGADQPVTLELGTIRQVTSLPGLEDQPAISPDGKMVAFVWQETDNKDIWVKQVSGGAPFKLTDDPADDTEPDWSPDGSTIVFRSGRRGGGLYTIPALRGDVTKLTDFGFRPRWSPDGKRVLFQNRAGGILPDETLVVDYPGGMPRKLLVYEAGGKTYQYGEWSPDGTRVVSRAGTLTGGWGLFVAPSTGRDGGFFLEWNGQRIDPGPTAWAAGGRALIVQQPSAIGFVPVDAIGRAAGPMARLTTSPDTLGSVSLDGSVLAYVGGRLSQSDIWKVAIDPATGMPVGKASRVIASSAKDLQPYVLPDGRHLLFMSERDGERHLYVADVDGQHAKVVDKSHNWRAIGDVSRDGRAIALWVQQNAKPALQPFVLAFDPETLEAVGPPRPLGADSIPWNFSPDGRYLLYALAGADPLGIVRAWEHPMSDRPVAVEWPLGTAFLSTHPSPDISPRFSADGRWLLIGMEAELGKPGVFAVRPGGTDPRFLWKGTWRVQPNPDPRRLYVVMPRGDGVLGELGFMTFDPETGTVTSGYHRVPFEPGRGSVANNLVSFSPNGRWLFFAWNEDEGDVFVANLTVR